MAHKREQNFAETYFFEHTLSQASILHDASKEADLPASQSADAVTTPQTHAQWWTFGHSVAKLSDRKLFIFRYISGHALLDEDTIKIEQKCTSSRIPCQIWGNLRKLFYLPLSIKMRCFCIHEMNYFELLWCLWRACKFESRVTSRGSSNFELRG